MGNSFAVTGHGGRASVKDGGQARIIGEKGPVPVRGGALVATCVAQRLLVRIDKVTVPDEEIAVKVDVQSLLNMGSDEVVKTIACAGHVGRIIQRRFSGVKTLDSVGVSNPI